MMRAVADRGLQAYAVPSARAGQQTDPAARRDVLSGLMTGGFLLAVIATVLAIIIAAPQYAEPAAVVAVAPVASGDPIASTDPTHAGIGVAIATDADGKRTFLVTQVFARPNPSAPRPR